MDEKLAEVVLAYAENDMSTTATANQLFFHRNSVDYHLSRVHRVTGKNPRRFYDLCELVGEAKRILKQAEQDNDYHIRGDLCKWILREIM